MNRQCSFTEADIEPAIHNLRLLRYDLACANRNAKNLKRWQDKWTSRNRWTVWTESEIYDLPTYLRMKAAL